MRQALRFALQLQAGKYSTSTSVTENTNTDLDKNTDSTTGGNDTGTGTGSSGSEGQLSETSINQLQRVSTNTETSSIPSNPLPSTTTTTPATTNKAQIVLSRWAVDTAFSTILKVPTPRMGRPAARKIDDILSLVTDKHEKSLVGNVISPQDIGVTYDMIGKRVFFYVWNVFSLGYLNFSVGDVVDDNYHFHHHCLLTVIIYYLKVGWKK